MNVYYDNTKNRFVARYKESKSRWRHIGNYMTRDLAQEAFDKFVPEKKWKGVSTVDRSPRNFVLKKTTLKKLNSKANSTNKYQHQIIEDALEAYWSKEDDERNKK